MTTMHETTPINDWQQSLQPEPEANRLVPAKPQLAAEVPLAANVWMPEAVIALNRRAPMLYELLNRCPALLPAEDWTHGFKASPDLLAQERGVEG